MLILFSAQNICTYQANNLELGTVIPGMCRTKLDIYVFIDFPVYIPWTHQMKIIPGMCRTKLDIYGRERTVDKL